jgi:predicted transcriptional regulator
MAKPPEEANAGMFVVPEEHRAAIREGLEQAERGDFVSDDEMEALWKRCGL